MKRKEERGAGKGYLQMWQDCKGPWLAIREKAKKEKECQDDKEGYLSRVHRNVTRHKRVWQTGFLL